MKKKIFQKRFPTYFGGFFFGLLLVLFILQMKKLVAPEFPEEKFSTEFFEISKGGTIRLQLGENPGQILAWGFPTKLAIGKKNEDGSVSPITFLEYKELVEKETLLGPFADAGNYLVKAKFSACAYPGEKYCVAVILDQEFAVKENSAKEKVLSIPLKEFADRAAKSGLEKSSKN
jgi:hypothetical protein